MSIPKKIYTFWDKKDLPPVIHNCIQTWRFLNPDYEIVVLNSENVRKYAPEVRFDKLKHGKESLARFSDYVRLAVLSKHGGIWLDASIICIQSFDVWFDSWREKHRSRDIEFFGFYNEQFTTKKKYPVIESWAFACVKGSKFVKAWTKEFMATDEFETIDEYLESREDDFKVDFQKIDVLDDANYLAIHISAQKVLQSDRYDRKNMILEKAEDTALKYRLFRKGGVSLEKRVARLCKDFNFWAVSPIIKFTGEDREVLVKKKNIRNCVFNNLFVQIMRQKLDIRE